MSTASVHRLVLSLAAAGLLAALAACAAGDTPRLIGAYPPETIESIVTLVPPAGAPPVVHEGFVSLQVADVYAAAEAASGLADDLGGYRASQHHWFSGDDPHITLTLAVPAPQFESLRAAVLDLGRARDERLTAGPVPLPPGGTAWSVSAHLTVQLDPAPRPQWRLPRLPDFGWRPSRTFASAFAVFAAVFTFLLDVLIWLSVVVGPFVLLGLGLRWLVRQARPPVPPADKP
jgi:hypothetical protein